MSALLLVLLSFIVGCGQEDDRVSANEFLIFSDGLDRNIVLESAPGRVVSIAPGATHIVRSAGSLASLVAVTTADYDAGDLAHLPRISALPLDLEAIVALDPDLILASDQVNDPSHAELFDALGIPIVYLGSGSWDEVVDSIALMGQMLETETSAGAAVDSLQNSLAELKDVTSNIANPPSAIFLVSPIQSYSFGQGSFVLDLMEWAGMDPLTDEFDTPAPVLDDEWVLLRNPDIIVGAFGEDFSIDELLENHPTWHTLDAVRQGRIINVPVPTILTPGPENIRAAWYMARQAHPDLFTAESVPAQ